MSPVSPMPVRSPAGTRSTPVAVVGWLSLLSALGCALLGISHLGVEVPLLSAAGPGGTRVVPQAAAAFTVAAALYALVTAGVFRRARWAWPAAVVVHGLAILAGLGQFRGLVSALGIVLAAGAMALLVTPSVRRDLRTGR